ncbi:MAG: hypothetical protein IJ594_08535 [Oscillospiraceae bacterium]|nr:hypothetical protein [Oscillospiraceae bacterium]
MRRIREFLFCAICFGFSAAVLVLSLLGAVQLTARNDEVAALEKEIALLREENAVRSAACESMLNLGEIERRAVQELGMQTCSPGQIVYLEYPREG